jgi:hypothetical protein
VGPAVLPCAGDLGCRGKRRLVVGAHRRAVAVAVDQTKAFTGVLRNPVVEVGQGGQRRFAPLHAGNHVQPRSVKWGPHAEPLSRDVPQIQRFAQPGN